MSCCSKQLGVKQKKVSFFISNLTTKSKFVKDFSPKNLTETAMKFLHKVQSKDFIATLLKNLNFRIYLNNQKALSNYGIVH